MSWAKSDSPQALEDRAIGIVHRPRLDPVLAARWDALVDSRPGADVTQYVEWGRLRRLAGFEPSFLLAYRGTELVGGAQLYRRRIPLLGGIGYVPYGPLVFCETDREPVRQAVCRALGDLGGLGLRALFVQPPDGAEETSEVLSGLGFEPSAAGIAPRSTLRIDLTQPETELHAALGRKLRRWTKRWPNHGVRVRQGDHRDLPVLASLHRQTAHQQGFPPLSLSYLRHLYAELAPSGKARIFVGEINGEPVAASLMTACGGVLKSRVSGFRRGPETEKLRVPAAIRWSAIRWAKENGFRRFDFGGLSEQSTAQLLSGRPVAPSELPGSDQFKISFGGFAHRYPPPMELIGSPLLRRAYHLSKRVPGADRIQSTLRSVFRGGSGAR